MAYMTRDEMIGVIRSGQVVLHKGRLIATEADIPTSAELANGDPAKMQAAKTDLEAEIARLQKQKADLETAEKAKAEAKASSADDEPDDRPTQADIDRVSAEFDAREKKLADEKAAFEKAKADHEASVKATADAKAKADADAAAAAATQVADSPKPDDKPKAKKAE